MSKTDELPPDAYKELEASERQPHQSKTRRSFHWPTVVLVLALVATAGFLAGVQVQKRQGGSTTSVAAGAQGGTRTGTQNGRTGGAGANAAGGAGATVGQVKVIDGTTMYVLDRDGNTVRVSTSPSARVSKTVDGTMLDVRPGDTVIVQGTKAADGSVDASSVTLGGAGIFGGGGGRGGRTGGGGGGGGGRGTGGGPSGG
jgi:hypothetical protein